MIFGKNKKVLTKYNQTNKTNNILKNRESRKLPEFQPFPEACVAERGPLPCPDWYACGLQTIGGRFDSTHGRQVHRFYPFPPLASWLGVVFCFGGI